MKGGGQSYPILEAGIPPPPFRLFPVTFTWEFPDGTESTYTIQMIQYEGRPAFTLDMGLMANQRKEIERAINEKMRADDRGLGCVN